MRSRYKEIGKKVPQAYLRYVEDTFLPCDAVDALRCAKATDRDGRQTRYSYTERGLLKSIGTDEGSITYVYDGAGRVIEQTAYTEANGHTYRTRYRYAGRTVTEERGAYITTYTLDGWGKPIRKTNGEGWAERYRYDGAGRISEVRDDIGLLAGYTYNELSLVASERHGTEIPVLYTYNAIGLLEKAERGNEILLTRSYDKAGRLVREKKQGVPEKTYRYDALGRLTEVQSAGAVQAQYRYGAYGKTVTYTDGAGSEYLFEKDSYGLLTTEHDRLGKQQQYRYSAEDELTEAHQRNGGVRSVTRRKRSEITTYRDGSRYEITKDITGAVIFEKGIDGEGKRISEVTYRYDEAGQLIEQADDAGDTRIIYRYNKAGYRTEMQTNDRYVVYDFDGRGRVTEVSDRKQYFKVRAFYDENDREIKRILGNGNKQDYTYDEAGRLLGIVETDSNWAIIRAECYGYDGEGRRIFTADEKGNLTRYVYDEQYRIKEVQYPASEELRAYHREEAKEARLFIDEGAASHRREIMNPVELAQISATFSRLIGARTSNLGSMVNSIQLVWTEQYTYDANGNIATKTTPYGTIHYSYDKENRLLTRGAVHYTYDEEGNLLREEQSDYYLKRYEYAGFNRMEMSDIINYRDNTHVITDYRYDSFGRRIHTAERTKSGMRTIYDGLSFEVVKEGETIPDSRSITTTGTSGATINEYKYDGSHRRGTRYYFIRDGGQELRTGKSGEALPDRTKGVRTYLYLNGERVAVNNLYNTNHGQYYYGSDILGSVKFVTGQAGQEVRRIEYDVFGGIYKGNSPYGLETGYTGKPYDAVTGLSDYGFRDYSPTHARFITEDPIRDGENWFAYVGNNPVNWVDPWGLEIILHKGSTLIRFMEDGDWEYDSVYAFQRTGLDKSFIGKILNYLGIHDNGKKLLGKVEYDYDNTYLNTEGHLDVAHDRYRIKDIHTGKDKGGLYVTAREDAKEENRVKIGQFIGSVTADAITGKGLIKGAIAGKNVLRKVTSALSEAYKPTPAGVLMTTGFAIGTATEDTTVQDVALSMIPGVGSIGAYNAWLDTMFKDTLITNSNLLKDVPPSKKNR